jgi:hypothetical protein
MITVGFIEFLCAKGTDFFDYPFKDEAQTALFKDLFRTAQ